MTDGAAKLMNRRAIEALRAGVPNSDAVRMLGSHHPRIEEKFRELLTAVDESGINGSQARGFLVSGEFGSGKSHLLKYLESVALEENFVCSRIVVSKETALSDPSKVYAAMVSEGRVPGRLGAAIPTLAEGLLTKFNSSSYKEFFLWSGQDDTRLAHQFPASLYILEYGGDQEYAQKIARYWAGDPLHTGDLRSKLRELGQLSNYQLATVKKRDLAFQRLRFAPRLARAAGYRGWIVLIDETELIGRYARKARANAYAELARWTGRLDDTQDGIFPGLGGVAAITGDFETKVLMGGVSDLEVIPNKLRASPNPADVELGGLARRGMQLILKEREELPALTGELMKETHDKLRVAYSVAFNWPAPEVQDCFAPLATDVMRPFVRRWITQWDIGRLYPESTFDGVEARLEPDLYPEDPDLASDAVADATAPVGSE